MSPGPFSGSLLHFGTPRSFGSCPCSAPRQGKEATLGLSVMAPEVPWPLPPSSQSGTSSRHLPSPGSSTFCSLLISSGSSYFSAHAFGSDLTISPESPDVLFLKPILNL